MPTGRRRSWRRAVGLRAGAALYSSSSATRSRAASKSEGRMASQPPLGSSRPGPSVIRRSNTMSPASLVAAARYHGMLGWAAIPWTGDPVAMRSAGRQSHPSRVSNSPIVPSADPEANSLPGALAQLAPDEMTSTQQTACTALVCTRSPWPGMTRSAPSPPETSCTATEPSSAPVRIRSPAGSNSAWNTFAQWLRLPRIATLGSPVPDSRSATWWTSTRPSSPELASSRPSREKAVAFTHPL
mmetsp:Transcript_509/g.1971  ORF Transcript_509/g.1971 Transcript_509/m.1971 type:complete len:242 (+) Transcript_509:3004-3729(+)